MNQVENQNDIESAKASQLILALNRYSVIPTDRQKKRLKYFFGPYNDFFNTHKYMKFDQKYEKSSWSIIKETILQRDQNLSLYLHETVKNAATQSYFKITKPTNITPQYTITSMSQTLSPSPKQHLTKSEKQESYMLDLELARKQFQSIVKNFESTNTSSSQTPKQSKSAMNISKIQQNLLTRRSFRLGQYDSSKLSSVKVSQDVSGKSQLQFKTVQPLLSPRYKHTNYHRQNKTIEQMKHTYEKVTQNMKSYRDSLSRSAQKDLEIVRCRPKTFSINSRNLIMSQRCSGLRQFDNEELAEII